MTYQEKSSVVSIFSSLFIFALYCVWVFLISPDNSTTPEGTIRYWGLVMVLMIPVQIIPRIIIEIVFMIINSIVTREKAPSFSDELDKLINLKAARNSLYGFCTVFFASMGLLALGLPLTAMFYTMFFGFIACGLITEISQFIYYRRGI